METPSSTTFPFVTFHIDLPCTLFCSAMRHSTGDPIASHTSCATSEDEISKCSAIIWFTGSESLSSWISTSTSDGHWRNRRIVACSECIRI